MSQCTFRVKIYSPRWGHDDGYEFNIDENQMEITGVSKSAVCKWRDNKDPVWQGYNDVSGNPFVKVLENDHIHPPSVFVFALEQAWKSWRDGELDCAEFETEINALVNWLNDVSQNKPKTDFWTKIF